MINWCNQNQGFLMVLLTFVYVIATIVICFFNYKTIAEQRRIDCAQKNISSFSLRYEIYNQIINELHLWRFSSNNQVSEFSLMNNKNAVLLYLATHNQNYYDLSVKANLVFDEEICKRVDAAWSLIRKEIYPPINDIVTRAPIDTSPTSILVQIKYAMQEESLKSKKDKLFGLEAEITALIENEIQIRDSI